MNKVIRSILSILVLALAWQVSLAQSRVITGTVKDNNGEAVIGASIIVKGTNTGTYTDVDGNYSISIPANATALTFKYLGYKTSEVPVGANTVVNVSLEEDVLGLEEVVVTAIGISAEKKGLGYAVQDVSGERLTQAGANNALSALSGKVAGLQVITSTGSPGSAVYLELRGATSITGSNAPLFVVDGIPVDNTENYSGNPDNVGALINNNLLGEVGNSNRAIDINPDDIESITVLKGPTATALYGIRAAHGVIVITTKKGGPSGVGKGLHATYSSTFTMEHVNKMPELQDKYIKGLGGNLTVYDEFASRSWGAMADTLFWDPSQATPFNQYGELVGKTYAETIDGEIPFVPYDNVDQFFRTGTTFENNIALSGGSDRGGVRLSFGVLQQDGVVPLSSFNRYNAKLAGEMQISDKWGVGGSVSYTKSGGSRVQQGSNVSGLMLGLTRTPISFDNSNGQDDPTDPSAYLLPDGTPRAYIGHYDGTAGLFDNPYWTINQNPFVDDVNRVFGYGEVTYSPWVWLKITERLGVDFYNDIRKQIFAIYSQSWSDGQVTNQNYFYRHINNDILATASKDFSDKFTGSLTVGFNTFSQRTKHVYVQGDNLVIPDFYNMSNATDVLAREVDGRYRTQAVYGALELAFANMLYLTATGRNEWSSTLPVEDNNFFYPSAGLSFVFTEAFGMSNSKVLPFGKIRVSWAQVGADAPIYALQNYFTQGVFADGWTSGVAFPLPDRNGDTYNGYTYAATLGNSTLKPEKTNSFEVGAELRFVNNRIGIDFTYYETKSIDLIVPVPVAGSSGFQQAYLNSGSLQNKGVELALNITPVRSKDWRWDIGINWSQNKSEVLELAEGVDNLFLGGFEGSAVYAVPGEPYPVIYGSRWLREDTDGDGLPNADGAIIINDDPNSATYGMPILDALTGPIGQVDPDWIAGANTVLSWKGLSLYILFDVRMGGSIWNGTRGALNSYGMSVETEDRGQETVFEGVKGHLDPITGEVVLGEGVNDIPVALDEAWYRAPGLGGGFNGATEQFIEDGSYVKLKEMSLTYTLDPKVLSKTPISGLDISIIGRNLWLDTDYKGVDPETSLTGANNSQGMDYFNMPGTRSFGVNLRITL